MPLCFEASRAVSILSCCAPLRRGHERNVYTQCVASVITVPTQLWDTVLGFHGAWTKVVFKGALRPFIGYLGGGAYSLELELHQCPISVRRLGTVATTPSACS